MDIYPSGTNEGSFTVNYNKCGVKFRKSIAEYNLTVLRPPHKINANTKTFVIQCNYPSKVDKASKDLTVVKNNKIIRRPASSMSVSPSHEMALMYNNKPVKQVEAGKLVIAKICIMPKVFRAMIKKCNISTNDNKEQKVVIVTQEDGCPAEPDFGPWVWNEETHCYQADFKTFKFRGRGNLKLDCEVHYCIEGQCRIVRYNKINIIYYIYTCVKKNRSKNFHDREFEKLRQF